MITTLGTIKNASANCLGSIVVEVKYFDANDALIDTITELVNDLVVPSKGEVAFRVRDVASRPKEAYATQKIRVVSALPKGGRTSAPDSMMETIGTYLLSWAPMLLLIGVWIFFMKRMQRTDSPQARTITLIEEQNVLFDAQNKLLTRIAAAVERKSGKVE
jgi:ATP-dependent Zn protease